MVQQLDQKRKTAEEMNEEGKIAYHPSQSASTYSSKKNLLFGEHVFVVCKVHSVCEIKHFQSRTQTNVKWIQDNFRWILRFFSAFVYSLELLVNYRCGCMCAKPHWKKGIAQRIKNWAIFATIMNTDAHTHTQILAHSNRCFIKVEPSFVNDTRKCCSEWVDETLSMASHCCCCCYCIIPKRIHISSVHNTTKSIISLHSRECACCQSESQIATTNNCSAISHRIYDCDIYTYMKVCMCVCVMWFYGFVRINCR